MRKGITPSRRQVLGALVAAPVAGLATGCAPPGGEGTLSTSEPLTFFDPAATLQQLCDSFYDLANELTIRITMPEARWTSLRTEQPLSGPTCEQGFNWMGGDRYTWFAADSVEITGSVIGSKTFSNVGIKKKSFCGSISSTVPCLKLDLDKYNAANGPVADSFIGIRQITLNNSLQDPSYVRQNVGYFLYKLAGLPYSRCNYARVFVNDVRIGYIYVNVEPVRERYIERHFGGNLSGNLYEFEQDDFTQARLPYIDVESISHVTNKADLVLAAQHIATSGVAGLPDVVDMDHYLKFFAMECLLQHWDSYSNGGNNTYAYNDVVAVDAPGLDNVNFKLIPWGLDQILKPDNHFKVYAGALLTGPMKLSNLVRGDATRLAELQSKIRTLGEAVFSRQMQYTTILPYMSRLQSVLTAAGIPNVALEIDKVRTQIRLARSAAHWFGGQLSTSDVNVLDSPSRCLIASTEVIGGKSSPEPDAQEATLRHPLI